MWKASMGVMTSFSRMIGFREQFWGLGLPALVEHLRLTSATDLGEVVI